jgi:hypothetical protein
MRFKATTASRLAVKPDGGVHDPASKDLLFYSLMVSIGIG